MTQVSIGRLITPDNNQIGSTTGSGNLLIDNTSEKIAFVFTIPKTGTLHECEVLLGTVTQAPSNGLRFSFQTVDTSTTPSTPSGTATYYRVVTSGIASNTWLASGIISDDGSDTGNKLAVTAGDMLAVVIEFSSFNASDSVRLARHVSTQGGNMSATAYLPYGLLYTSSWAAVGDAVSIALKYSDGTYAGIGWELPPISAASSVIYNVDSGTSDEYGAKFTPAVPMTVSGAYVDGDLDGDYSIVLYDSDGTTALETVAIDKDSRRGTSSFYSLAHFPSEVTLSAGSAYRLTLKPTTTTNVKLFYIDFASTAIADAHSLGSAFHFTQRLNGGSWTDTTTRRPSVGFMVSKLSDGAGGGGGGMLVHPGMTGGMRG